MYAALVQSASGLSMLVNSRGVWLQDRVSTVLGWSFLRRSGRIVGNRKLRGRFPASVFFSAQRCFIMRLILARVA